MRILTITCVMLWLASCHNNTKPPAAVIADTLSLPKDSLAFYFPAGTFYDRPSSDSFLQNWYGSALYSCKEPVLSQGFRGQSIYRFLWLRSFHRPVVFTLHRVDDEVWLTTKMLDQQPSFHDQRFGGIAKEERQEYIRDGYVVDSSRPNTMIKYADRKATIVYNKQLPLSVNEWDEFERLLAEANFWKLPADIDEGNTDGAMWVYEGRLKNLYHVVSYHSPGNRIYGKAGRYLIKLSGLQEKIY